MENRRSQTSFRKFLDEQRTKDPFPKPTISKTKSIDNSDMALRPNFEYWQRNHGTNCCYHICSVACVDCYHSSKQGKFYPQHDDPHCNPEGRTSSSDSDDEIQTSEAAGYEFVKQRSPEEIDRDISVKLRCKVARNVFSPVLRNSMMAVSTGRNELNETEASLEDALTRRQSSEETKSFPASRNNVGMKGKGKRGGRWKADITSNRTVDNQNHWKGSALEKQSTPEKDLLSYFEKRVVGIQEANISVDIIEPKMQLETDLGNAESFAEWITPTHISPIRTVSPFSGFSQSADDASIRISNCDNAERTELLKYHTDLSRERDCRCTSMNKDKGGGKDYFETAKNKRSSNENINYAKTSLQDEKISLSKNCGQKGNFQQRKRLMQEREMFRSSSLSLSHSEDSDIQINTMKTENEDRVRIKPFYSKEPHYIHHCDKQNANCASMRSRDTAGNQRKNVQHSTRLYNESCNLQSVGGQGANACRNDGLQSSFKQEQKGMSYNGARKKSNFMEDNLKNHRNDNGEEMHTPREGCNTARNHRRSLQNRNTFYRSSACDSTHVLCQEENEKSQGVTEVCSFNNRSQGHTNNQPTVSRKMNKQHLSEENSVDLVKNLSELIETLSVLVEDLPVSPGKDHHILHIKQKPQTFTSSRQHLQNIHPLQQDPQYIKSVHETEMHAAQNTAVISLKEHGNRLNQSMLMCHMMLKIFRATYKIWLKAREVTLTMLKSLSKKGSQNNGWENSLKTIFNFVKVGSTWASQILNFTPYAKSPLTNMMKLVPVITDQAEKLILPLKGTQEIKEFQTELVQIMQQDNQFSSDFEEFALQCETQFKETVNLFFEFQSVIHREHIADFVGDEDMDLLNFLIDWSAAGPELSTFVQQVSDAYMKYHNTTDKGPANAQAIFCSFIDHDPSAVNTMRCLDWNFTQVFQRRTTNGDLSSCWMDVRQMISDPNGNSVTNISDVIASLETHKRNVIQSVSELFESSRGSHRSDY